jgi:hypothetical protein
MMKIVVLAGLVLAVGAGAFAVAAAGGDVKPSCALYKLDRQAWNTGGKARSHQAHRLVACRRLIGKSRSKVHTLLGPADERGNHELAYQLGPDALGIDSEYLSLRFSGGAVTARVPRRLSGRSSRAAGSWCAPTYRFTRRVADLW